MIAMENLPKDRRKAPEARQLHVPENSHEHIGRVVVTAESKPKEVAEQKPRLAPNKNVETMSRTELLEFSDSIKIEGTTLRQVFETHLVSEKGLRRLIGEHLHGGDIKKALQAEILEHEIDFERDPAMRGIAPTEVSTPSLGSTSTLDELLQKADSSVSGDVGEVAYDKHEPKPSKPPLVPTPQMTRRTLDIVFVSIILILLVLVLALVIIH